MKTMCDVRLLKVLFLAALLPGAMACAQNSASAPFHMYSSPLLDGEMAPPNPHRSDEAQGAHPGVQPRQVYTFQRWKNEAEPQRQILADQRQGPRLDTVEPPTRPVLAQYRPTSATGAGRAPDDGGNRSSSAPAPSKPSESSESSESSELKGLSPSVLSAGYIYTLLKVNEVEVPEEAATSIPEIFRACRADGEVYHSSRPNIGDLVFFHNTYDANEDGRNNDWYTLVGIVEQVHPSGTIDFLAFFNGEQVQRLHMNLEQPDRQFLDSNLRGNSQVRKQSADDAPFTQYLAGQLFAGFCNFLGDREDLIVIDNWRPDF